MLQHLWQCLHYHLAYVLLLPFRVVMETFVYVGCGNCQCRGAEEIHYAVGIRPVIWLQSQCLVEQLSGKVTQQYGLCCFAWTQFAQQVEQWRMGIGFKTCCHCRYVDKVVRLHYNQFGI